MSVTASTGLVSGIDYQTLIASLTKANSQPIKLMQNRQNKLTTQGTAMNAVESAVKQFSTAAAALADSSAFQNVSATTSDAATVAVTAQSTAAPGNHSVLVKQLAQAARIASQGVETTNATSIADQSGTFEFKLGDSTATSIQVSAGMTLQDLVDKINATTNDSGVKASIVNDGTTTGANRLLLTSQRTGAANQLSIVNNDTTLNLTGTTIEDATAGSGNSFDGTVTSSGTYTGSTTKNFMVQITSGGSVGTAKFKVSTDGGLTWSADDAYTTSASAQDISGGEGVNLAFGAGTKDLAVGDTFGVDAFAPELQKAQNAIAVVDGIQVSRAANVFTGVIDGVTLTAKKVSTDPVTVGVTANSSAVTSKITALVNAYNTVVSTVNQQTAYDKDTNTAAALFGNSLVGTMMNTLHSTMTSAVSGLAGSNSLSAIGITVQKDGSLGVDTTKLNAALADNPDAVQSIFAEVGHSSSTSVAYVGSSDKTPTGKFDIQVTRAATQATINGSLLGSGTLAADETLTVGLGDTSTAVTIKAGSTLDEAVDAINAKLTDKGIAALASNDGGRLKLSARDYGSSEKLTAVSDRASGTAGQLGIGTTLRSVTGQDVRAVINGLEVTGIGQSIHGSAGTAIDGLSLDITATEPMTATVTLTRGIADQLNRQMTSMLDSSTGLFATNAKNLKDQIADYDDQITKLNDRLTRQEESLKTLFNNLETKLSTLKSQGDSMLASLDALNGNSSSK